MARRAFTLIELLVVIAIIAVVIALLVPAVQKVRSAAARTSCQNNLHQLVVGTHHYHADKGRFPGMGISPNQTSVLVELLPYLEQDSLKNLYDPSQPLFTLVSGLPVFNAAQSSAATTRVEMFLCPADDKPPFYDRWGAVGVAGTNYMACSGTGTGVSISLKFPTDGMFWNGPGFRSADVADGLSNTLLLSESLLGAATDSTGPTPAEPGRQMANLGGGRYRPDPIAGTIPAFPGCGGVTRWSSGRGAAWIYGLANITTFNTYLTPNEQSPDCTTDGFGWFKAASLHTGGVNVALGDGSVRFVSDGVALSTWRALATRVGSDAVGDY